MYSVTRGRDISISESLSSEAEANRAKLHAWQKAALLG
jgi:hypothetical protein